jgi:hypothetical protein
MDLKKNFVFRPKPAIPETADSMPKTLGVDDDLGPLALLVGSWQGTGMNTIWRPDFTGNGHFLELNLTVETLDVERIQGNIPNRGLFQADINMTGVHYLQQVQDAQGPALHFEPGIWLNIPETTVPAVPASVARLGSIPHGTTVLAQGLATSEARAPIIQPVDITPFRIGDPGSLVPFPESNLSIPTQFRTQDITGITQAMVDNVNSVLTDAIAGQNIINTINLVITTMPEPVPGGGTANTAFLEGTGPQTANADAVEMTSIFWIETVQDPNGNAFLQLQYTQTVMLDFNGLTWPHVSVATLRQVSSEPSRSS